MPYWAIDSWTLLILHGPFLFVDERVRHSFKNYLLSVRTQIFLAPVVLVCRARRYVSWLFFSEVDCILWNMCGHLSCQKSGCVLHLNRWCNFPASARRARLFWPDTPQGTVVVIQGSHSLYSEELCFLSWRVPPREAGKKGGGGLLRAWECQQDLCRHMTLVKCLTNRCYCLPLSRSTRRCVPFT